MLKQSTISIHSAVNLQLLELGYFSPLEYLLSSGRLDYADYEAWRTGKINTLDDVLLGSREKILDVLREAISFAEKLQLVPAAQEFMAWDSNGAHSPLLSRELQICRNPQLASLLSNRFEPDQSHPQMDMFIDNPQSVVINQLIEAILARRHSDAESLLNDLYERAPERTDLASFDLIVQALGQMREPARGSNEELELIEDQVQIIAPELLGGRWREFADGLWHWLANARIGKAMDSREPRLHSSYMLAQARDWNAVKKSILAEEHWARFAELGFRLAEAFDHLGDRSGSLGSWSQMCWRFPDDAESRLNALHSERGFIAEPFVAELWHGFSAMEDHFDLDGPLDCQLFPAWILLRESALANLLESTLAEGDSHGETIFRICHDLASAKLESASEIEHRKILNQTAPLLLKFYLSQLQNAGLG